MKQKNSFDVKHNQILTWEGGKGYHTVNYTCTHILKARSLIRISLA